MSILPEVEKVVVSLELRSLEDRGLAYRALLGEVHSDG